MTAGTSVAADGLHIVLRPRIKADDAEEEPDETDLLDSALDTHKASSPTSPGSRAPSGSSAVDHEDDDGADTLAAPGTTSYGGIGCPTTAHVQSARSLRVLVCTCSCCAADLAKDRRWW